MFLRDQFRSLPDLGSNPDTARRLAVVLKVLPKSGNKHKRVGVPWWSRGQEFLAVQGMKVQSLVGEIRSHALEPTKFCLLRPLSPRHS